MFEFNFFPSAIPCKNRGGGGQGCRNIVGQHGAKQHVAAKACLFKLTPLRQQSFDANEYGIFDAGTFLSSHDDYYGKGVALVN